MSATRRFIFLVAPEQKSRLTNHARAAKLSVDEYVRNRALDEGELLKALVVELRASTVAVVSRVDDLVRRLEERDRARRTRRASACPRLCRVRCAGDASPRECHPVSTTSEALKAVRVDRHKRAPVHQLSDQ